MNIEFDEFGDHSHMNARTITLCKMSIPPESNSALRSRLDCDLTDGMNESDLINQAEKGHCLIFPQQYENITYAYIADRMHSSILFC